MKPLFFYGTLRDRELLEIVLGRPVASDELTAASAAGYAARRIEAQAYPLLLPAAGEQAPGVVFRPATPADVARVSWYEEAEYDLVPLQADTADGQVEAWYFRATGKVSPGGERWRIEDWQGFDRLVAIEAAREFMPHFATVAMEDVDTIWPAIMTRARARARALLSTPPAPRLASPFRRETDMRLHAHTRPFTGYLAVEEHEVSHRRFDGSWSHPAHRTTVAWGDAVTVLPYDAVTDRVLLIEQFRIATAARLDPAPWCIEVVAGRIDADESDEEAARREALEEAGIALGRMVRLPGYYTTPGMASEHLSAFIAEADLSGVGSGVFGAEDEQEDIRRIVVPFDEAMAALEAGEVDAGPAQISLLWLALRRAELRGAWAAGASAGAGDGGA